VKQSPSFLQFLLPLITFTIGYGIVAYSKPFHVDEFFSWVYAKRCSYEEILFLKEFGIGHPPLFHLLQKLIMDIIPGYHFIEVRLVNYVCGGAFVFLIAYMLTERGAPLSYIVAISFSAAVLNLFVFARMWGLVCVASLLLLWVGEKYVRSPDLWKFTVLIGVALLGFFSDYNFILMLPYLLFVLSNRFDIINPKKIMYGTLVPLLFLATLYKTKIDSGMFGYFTYYFARSIPALIFEISNTIVNFWFFEPFMVAFFLLLTASFLFSPKTEKEYAINTKLKGGSLFIFSIFIFTLIEGLIRFSDARARHMIPILYLFVICTMVCLRKKKWEPPKAPARLFHSIAGAVLILLTINQFFWRNLIETRFLNLLLPIIFLSLILLLNKKMLFLFSMILMATGVLYITSSGVGDYFPPPNIDEKKIDFYQDVFSYSTRYMKAGDQVGENPAFLNSSPIEKYCSICNIGHTADNVWPEGPVTLLGWHDLDVSKLSRKHGVRVLNRQDVGLGFIDQFQFKYFKPIYGRRFTLYKFEPSKANNLTIGTCQK